MQFIRENIFYVVLVAATLLGITVFGVVGAGVGDDADTQLAKRIEVDRTLGSFQRGLPTKGAVVAQKARVAKVEVQAKLVEEATLSWSRGDSPMFETQDFKVDGKSFPAFRADPPLGGDMTQNKWDKWKKDSKEWQADSYSEHTGAAVSLMTKLVLENLRSTTPPTASAIGRERDARLFRLKNDRAEKERLGLRQRQPGAAGTGRDTVANTGEEIKVVHQISSRAESPEAQAETDARNQLAVTQSEKGYIYADLRAFNPVYPERESNMLPGARARLWGAWVQYRVCRDITTAIRKTITEALKADGKDAAKATVPQSPIKRVVDVQVRPFPYTGGTVMFTEGKGGSPGMEGVMPAPDKEATAPSLTGRVSNAQYDVIRYQFTVVMADKYVGQLIQHLYRQNDHFVLSFRMDRIDVGGSTRVGGAAREGQAGSGGDSTEDSLCYYGVDPVMRVTFDCEVLMRTNWCRDVMPEEVLTNLKTVPGLLRPQDIERLSRAASGLP